MGVVTYWAAVTHTEMSLRVSRCTPRLERLCPSIAWRRNIPFRRPLMTPSLHMRRYCTKVFPRLQSSWRATLQEAVWEQLFCFHFVTRVVRCLGSPSSCLLGRI